MAGALRTPLLLFVVLVAIGKTAQLAFVDQSREGLAADRVSLTPDALEKLVERLPKDRGVARQEIERLENDNSGLSTAINLTGNEFANTITGNAGVNTLDGGAGSDKLTGLGGDDIYLVDVIARATDEQRVSLSTLQALQIALPNGRTVPSMKSSTSRAKVPTSASAAAWNSSPQARNSTPAAAGLPSMIRPRPKASSKKPTTATA